MKSCVVVRVIVCAEACDVRASVKCFAGLGTSLLSVGSRLIQRNVRPYTEANRFLSHDAGRLHVLHFSRLCMECVDAFVRASRLTVHDS